MNRRFTAAAGLALTFSLGLAASTLSGAAKCRTVSGLLQDEWNGVDGTTGTLTNAGMLNGTTTITFTSEFVPTPDPTTFSGTDALTITTPQGVLKSNDVAITDIGGVSGAQFYDHTFTEIGRIDPLGSTGRFAGATGVLFLSGTSSDGGYTFSSRLTGEVCLAGE